MIWTREIIRTGAEPGRGLGFGVMQGVGLGQELGLGLD